MESNTKSKNIYFTIFDAVNFPENRHKKCGLNTAAARTNNYLKAYHTLLAIRDTPGIKAYFTLNQMVDSQFFLSRESFFKGGNLSKDSLRVIFPELSEGDLQALLKQAPKARMHAILKRLPEEPFDLLQKLLVSGKAAVSTFANGSDGGLHTVGTYASFSFGRLINKFQANPEINGFFLTSISSSSSYQVGTKTSQEDEKNSRVKGRINMCGFLMAVMTHDRAAIINELHEEHIDDLQSLKQPRFDVYALLEELKEKETGVGELANVPPGHYVRFTNEAFADMDVRQVFNYIIQLLKLDDFCNQHAFVFEAQLAGEKLYTVANTFHGTDRFLESCCQKLKVGPRSKLRRYMGAFVADVAKEMQDLKMTDRSTVYGILGEDSTRTSCREYQVICAVGFPANKKKHSVAKEKNSVKRSPDAEPDEDTVDSNLQNNVIPKMSYAAITFVNAMYNLQFAFKAQCAYIAEGAEDGEISLTEITTTKEKAADDGCIHIYPQWGKTEILKL